MTKGIKKLGGNQNIGLDDRLGIISALEYFDLAIEKIKKKKQYLFRTYYIPGNDVTITISFDSNNLCDRVSTIYISQMKKGKETDQCHNSIN